MSELNGYQLSRQWFDFSFDNPEKIRPIHSAIYFFAIEHCNRLGWKKKFGFPTQMAMEAIGVKNWRTYNKALTDLVDWGFIDLVEKSKNQYSSCIICLCKKYNSTVEPDTKSLDKALQKHGQKHRNITVGINKQDNNRTKEQGTNSSVSTNGTDFPDSCKYINEARELANLLLERIKQFDPTHKYHRNPPSLNSWILDIERAMRLDGRDYDHLEWVINFLFTQNHDIANFWAPNIQSGSSLREKFDTIKQQLLRRKGNGQSKRENISNGIAKVEELDWD